MNLSVQFCVSLFTDNRPSFWKEGGCLWGSWLTGEVSSLVFFGWGRKAWWSRNGSLFHLFQELPVISQLWMPVVWATSPGLTTTCRICCHVLWAVLSMQSSFVNWYWRFDNIQVSTMNWALLICFAAIVIIVGAQISLKSRSGLVLSAEILHSGPSLQTHHWCLKIIVS